VGEGGRSGRRGRRGGLYLSRGKELGWSSSHSLGQGLESQDTRQVLQRRFRKGKSCVTCHMGDATILPT
jgi:hypothetical protein